MHGGPPPSTVTLLGHRTLVGGRGSTPEALGGRWLKPLEALAREHPLHQPPSHSLALRRATEQAPTNLCPVNTKVPAAEAGGRRGRVSRQGVEARSEHAGDAALEASSAIKGLPSCDPDLPRAAAQELHNGVAWMHTGNVAGMHAA